MDDLIRALLDERLHPEAAALSAFREMPGGKARAYTVAEASNGFHGVEHIVRVGKATGKLASPDDDAYAVLDVLNAGGGSGAELRDPDRTGVPLVVHQTAPAGRLH